MKNVKFSDLAQLYQSIADWRYQDECLIISVYPEDFEGFMQIMRKLGTFKGDETAIRAYIDNDCIQIPMFKKIGNKIGLSDEDLDYIFPKHQ